MIITQANLNAVMDVIDSGDHSLRLIKLALPQMALPRIQESLKILVKEGTVIRFKIGWEVGYCRPTDVETVAHQYRYKIDTFLRKFCEGVQCE